MAQRPLLFFPRSERATRSSLGGGGGNYSIPSGSRQGERLTPAFRALHRSINSQRASLQQSTTGIDPEQVLVFEIVGSVEDFANAVKRIDGFQWLGEVELEDIQPSDDFYITSRKGEREEEKSMSGRLYLILTNVTAMEQLLSLWERYVNNPKESFERGYGRFKEVFKHLKDIRKWGVEDRFEETGILHYWEEAMQIDPNANVRFEVELWYKNSPSARTESFNLIENAIKTGGGRVITSCDIPEIRYHSILAELPVSEIQSIIEHKDTELVKCDNVMYFRPSGQIVASDANLEEAVEASPGEYALPSGPPVVGIFDGYPLNRHNILNDRLIIDDPDDLGSYYRVDDRKHGTMMCSLIVRGDLASNETPLTTPVYVRPIMRPNDFNRLEFVPNDILLVDTIHRAVKRIFEGEAGESPIAPTIKILNLSICDPARLFYNSISPLARLLDWLSYKYHVLFIVSTGNHENIVSLSIPRANFDALSDLNKEKIFTQEILNNSRNCRIMSPAESINCLTVGAVHTDSTDIFQHDPRINPYSIPYPSTYTAFGGGYRRSIKPDLVYTGGRQMYDFQITNNSILKPAKYNRPPGLLVAAPDSTLNKSIHEIGTSNSTALMTRNGAICYEILRELLEDNDIDLSPDMIPILLKAMLAHGCSWGEIGHEIERRLDRSLDNATIQKIKSRWIGYGFPDVSKVKECTEQRATVIGFGRLKEEEAHLYSLPLPPSLSSKTIKRRLTITLAWFSPISAATQKYRTTRLWFESNTPLARERTCAQWQAVRRGTLQHEIFEGSAAEAFVDGDSIVIKVNCTKDAASIADNSIPYALMVSLEVAEQTGLPIYQEVKERIVVPVAIEQTV